MQVLLPWDSMAHTAAAPFPELGSPVKVKLPREAMLRLQEACESDSAASWPRSTSLPLTVDTHAPATARMPSEVSAPSGVAAPPCPSSQSASLSQSTPLRSSALLVSFGAGLCAPPGLDPPEGMPSHGSVLHQFGTCRPCGWFWKSGGCQNGSECQHCHLCPESVVKQHKKAKQTMGRVQRALTKQASSQQGQNVRLPHTSRCAGAVSTPSKQKMDCDDVSAQGTPSTTASDQEVFLTSDDDSIRWEDSHRVHMSAQRELSFHTRAGAHWRQPNAW